VLANAESSFFFRVCRCRETLGNMYANNSNSLNSLTSVEVKVGGYIQRDRDFVEARLILLRFHWRGARVEGALADLCSKLIRFAALSFYFWRVITQSLEVEYVLNVYCWAEWGVSLNSAAHERKGLASAQFSSSLRQRDHAWWGCSRTSPLD